MVKKKSDAPETTASRLVFGQTIEVLREAAGISINQLCAAMPLSKHTYDKIKKAA